MKVSSKSISSPSRTEKYPPPLMRFLRSNVSSRSRGRSKTSPMFVRKKNNSVIETQEPSSPKVTCIGQVRVRRSSKNSGRRKSKTPVAKTRRCWLVRKALCFHHFAQKLRCRSFRGFRPVWGKWVLFFRFGYCKKVEISEDSPKMETNRIENYRTTESTQSENEEVDEEKETDLKDSEMAFSSSSPPKNALLLTRCRSAPYRSSSMSNRFWVSPLSNSETGDENEEQKALPQEEEIREHERPTLDRDADSRESEEKIGISKEFEGSIKNDKIKEIEFLGSSVRPLILTRCKSEPAKTGVRLNLHVCD